MSPDVPIRTCIGCGEKDSKDNLARIVLEKKQERKIELDPPACRPGRGAYVHRRASCVERGLEQRRLARAFRGPVEIPASLTDALTKATERVAM